MGERERKGLGRPWWEGWDRVRKTGKLGEKGLWVSWLLKNKSQLQTMGVSGRLAGSAGRACDS